MKLFRILCILTALVGAANADPLIQAVQNAASNIPAGLPNSGIAQGSMFLLIGTELGPDVFEVAGSFPLASDISGTSVKITVDGTVVDGIMYYSGSTQVAVILPSSTPTGSGTVTVTYNGLTSPPYPITVVSNAFGVFSIGQNGSGDSIAFLGPNLVTPSNAANPGSVVSFWGTGLAPVTFDETMAAEQFDMTDVPLDAFVGGTQANIVFRGRNACCSGVDAVYVEMPAGVVGCAVPVTFRSGNIVSNTTTIAVAASGSTCTPANPAVAGEDDFRNWFLRGTFTSGSIGLQRVVSVTPAYTVNGVEVESSTSRSDSISATFYRFIAPPGGAGLGSVFDIANFGACTVYSFRGQQPVINTEPLDAGDPISVNGPPGNFNLMKSTLGNTIAYSFQLDQTGTTIVPGSYTFNGPGGADIGDFSVDLEVPEPLIWTNQEGLHDVDRSDGVTVTWTGGDPSGYAQIYGYSLIPTDEGVSIGASFACTAPTSDGTYTVPSYILLALPPSGTQAIGGFEIPSFGTLSVNSYALEVIHADGLDFGTVAHTINNGNSVSYK